ncbi:tRNA dihydrouridine synthase DusB [Aeromicrobium sp. CTD01-1L150]|uniref:tRNA dihydrouridine synthase DusB n=1 Tax=Aeromicrobium sp. CTD01-1L150 TaxID=3341830 RepID=UPI0035C194EA
MTTATIAPEVAALRLGPLTLDVPVVLAPMAGVTNVAFRQLCAEQGAGLYVCEMITSRGLVEGDSTSLSMLSFAPAERVRSVQLYGIDPQTIGRAVRILCEEHGVDHVDLNFGCPVPKITRKGGGAALPWKSGLLEQILEQAVAGADGFDVPVTMKTRKGIDDDHLTFLDAGRIAQEAGCAAIALHGRTAAQHYSGRADWESIAELKEAVDIPVLGNGDIWEADDAVAMMESTGCDGVVVGRGCLGRPWLFADLAGVFNGAHERRLPLLGEVASVMRRHAELLGEWLGEERGCTEFRKHVAWYLKGFSAGSRVRSRLGTISSLAQLDALLAELDPDEPFPERELGTPRGRQGSPRKVALPDRWLDSRGVATLDAAAEDDTSGG